MSADLRSELQAIYDQHGRLTPALVVEEARDPAHPLHSRVFDKAEADAAEAYYRQRAHELITSVRVSYRPDPDGPTKSVRGFLAVHVGKDADNGGYVYEPAENVARDPVAQKVVLAEMERDWKTLRDRYREFEEFAEIVRSDSLIAV